MILPLLRILVLAWFRLKYFEFFVEVFQFEFRIVQMPMKLGESLNHLI